MIFIKRGAVQITINQKDYRAESGTLILIGALEQHELKIISRPYERYFCIFPPQLLEQPNWNPLLATAFKNRPYHFSHCLTLKQPDRVEKMMRTMGEEYDHRLPLAEEMTATFLEQLLIHVYREHPEQFFLPDTENAEKVWEVQRYLESHFSEPVFISDLAAAHFISTDYLGKIFKEMTGYTPKQYLMEYRLLHSRQLLLQTGLSVSTAAYRCGFKDVNNFIRTFKKRYGITPKQFQKNKFL